MTLGILIFFCGILVIFGGNHPFRLPTVPGKLLYITSIFGSYYSNMFTVVPFLYGVNTVLVCNSGVF